MFMVGVWNDVLLECFVSLCLLNIINFNESNIFSLEKKLMFFFVFKILIGIVWIFIVFFYWE